MSASFDVTRDHRFAPTRWFEDFEITDLIPQKTTGVIVMRATVHNQRSELVLEGLHRYLIRRAPSGS